jgi:hypothetical protein
VAEAGDGSTVPAWRELFVAGLGRTTLGLLLMEGLVAVQVLVTIAVLPAVSDGLLIGCGATCLVVLAALSASRRLPATSSSRPTNPPLPTSPGPPPP